MISTAIVCAFLLYLSERYRPLLVRVLERKLAPPLEAVEIPQDLLGMAMLYPDEWAQGDALKAMRETYGMTGSWDAVRQKFASPVYRGE